MYIIRLDDYVLGDTKEKNKMAKKSRSRGSKRSFKRTTSHRLRFYKPTRRPVPRSSVKTPLGRGQELRSRPVTKYKPVKKRVTGRPNKGLKQITKTHLTKQELKRRIICARRAIRNEVIHAIGKAGKSGQNRPNNQYRNIKC